MPWTCTEGVHARKTLPPFLSLIDKTRSEGEAQDKVPDRQAQMVFNFKKILSYLRPFVIEDRICKCFHDSLACSSDQEYPFQRCFSREGERPISKAMCVISFVANGAESSFASTPSRPCLKTRSAKF